MPDNDVTKMKVADLKRELKLRGLATTGNKTELQDRLQTALIDGDLSLEDTIASDDLLDGDEDGALTDEDSKLLAGDDDELLQSPAQEKEITFPLTTNSIKTPVAEQVLESVANAPSPAPKKIVLKRKNSLTVNTGTATSTSDVGATVAPAKENSEPAPCKIIKISTRVPITIDNKDSDKNEDADSGGAMTKKVAQLSLKERLALRAKKFGVDTAQTTTANKISTSDTGIKSVDEEKQIEMLKKRAERFGCVVSSKIAKINAEEKLLKRQQRFAANANTAKPDTITTSTVTIATTKTADTASDDWAEKARKRLERFNAAPTTNATAPTGN